MTVFPVSKYPGVRGSAPETAAPKGAAHEARAHARTAR
jgi:hypothetical protein